jgi:hypothetical protein
MWSIAPALLLALTGLASAATDAPKWSFNLKNETSGIVALEAIVVSPTLVLFFDREWALVALARLLLTLDSKALAMTRCKSTAILRGARSGILRQAPYEH